MLVIAGERNFFSLWGEVCLERQGCLLEIGDRDSSWFWSLERDLEYWAYSPRLKATFRLPGILK